MHVGQVQGHRFDMDGVSPKDCTRPSSTCSPAQVLILRHVHIIAATKRLVESLRAVAGCIPPAGTPVSRAPISTRTICAVTAPNCHLQLAPLLLNGQHERHLFGTGRVALAPPHWCFCPRLHAILGHFQSRRCMGTTQNRGRHQANERRDTDVARKIEGVKCPRAAFRQAVLPQEREGGNGAVRLVRALIAQILSPEVVAPDVNRRVRVVAVDVCVFHDRGTVVVAELAIQGLDVARATSTRASV
jgi:hypothetical protein